MAQRFGWVGDKIIFKRRLKMKNKLKPFERIIGSIIGTTVYISFLFYFFNNGFIKTGVCWMIMGGMFHVMILDGIWRQEVYCCRFKKYN